MTVLFVDDEAPLREAVQQTLDLADIDCQVFDQAGDVLAALTPDFNGVVVSDIRMPGMDGTALLRAALNVDADVPVLLVTGHGDVDLAVAMMREGAYDFIEKPFDPDRLVGAVRRALAMRRLTLENRQLRLAAGAGAGFRGLSEPMEGIRKQIAAIAASDADVLIVGETGTGKGLAAQAIHGASGRADKPFVTVNCAALRADNLESDLFGHEAGALPTTPRARVGKFEHARGGTLFLDEIDSLTLPMQAKLLSVVETGVMTRLGSHDPIELNVRFVAAAKSDLEAAAAEGTFRGDLLYRLNVVTLPLPTLAERREDVPVLFLEFVRDLAARHDRPAPQVPGAVLDAIAGRDWPGNVRELRNAAERFVLGLGDPLTDPDAAPMSLVDRLADHERTLIAASLASNGGRLKETYESLGISRKALYEKMQRYGLDRDQFREAEA